MPTSEPPIVVLGAGINGASIARELALNGCAVWIVDRADVCHGATAYSSRLIHGGLRYLEYGEFDLVAESLAERTRLLRLAPQFVRPLRLFIPGRGLVGGTLAALARFLGLSARPAARRGQWLVRAGLWFYDRYARDRSLPRHRRVPLNAADAPPVNREAYRWLCSYYDAQIAYPERFVQALLADTRELARARNVDFRLWTYCEARLDGAELRIAPVGDRSERTASAAPRQAENSVRPAAIINATGAWVDDTLAALPVPSERLLGGTKGSHLFTFHAPLRAAVAGGGVYTEASDGRPVFILPLGDGVLIGTTDLPYRGDPADAVADEEEIDYLLEYVNHVFPQTQLARNDVAWHYSGIRPLPRVDAQQPAAITRRHWVHVHANTDPAVYSIIGGKLTTCRSLAEETAHLVLAQLNRAVEQTSRELVICGGDDYPASAADLQARHEQLAREHDLSREQVASLWRLWGTRAADVAAQLAADERPSLRGTDLPRGVVRYCLQHEAATCLEDLIERRLMLLYEPRFTRETIVALADELAAASRLDRAEVPAAIERATNRLRSHFGWRL